MDLCIFIHFGKHPFIPRYVAVYLRELTKHFDQVICISNERPITSGLDKLPPMIRLMFVENEGYDLGMFYKAFQSIDLKGINKIACINDSNILINGLEPVFKWGENSGLDFWGIIDSYQKPWFSTNADNYHIQSHFLVFGKNAIQKLLLFFLSLNPEEFFKEKDQKKLRRKVIDKWEIGLTQFLLKEGLAVGSFIDSKSFSHKNNLKKSANLSHRYYLNLIEEGYPLVKKKVLLKNSFWNCFYPTYLKWDSLIQKHGNKDWEMTDWLNELKKLK